MEPLPSSSSKSLTSRHSNKLSQEIDSFPKTPLQRVKLTDAEVRQAKEAYQLLSELRSDLSDADTINHCGKLIELLSLSPQLKVNLSNTYGSSFVFGFIDVNAQTIRVPYLKVLNAYMLDNVKGQECLGRIGLIPILLRIVEGSCRAAVAASLSSNSIAASFAILLPSAFQVSSVTLEPMTIEAVKLISLLVSSTIPCQLFISCGGLVTLMDMLSVGSLILRPNSFRQLVAASSSPSSAFNPKSTEHPFRFLSPSQLSTVTPFGSVSEDAKMITYAAIEAILQICRVPSSYKRDYCRVLIKAGLISHLAYTFFNVISVYHRAYIFHCHGMSETAEASNDPDNSIEYKFASTVANIIYNFSKFDTLVAEAMAKGEPGGAVWVMLLYLRSPELQHSWHDSKFILSREYSELIVLMLKTLKNLSVEPSSLAKMDTSNTILTLVPLLNGPLNDKCKLLALSCVYNICRTSKKRQEQAAVSGIIPFLQASIRSNLSKETKDASAQGALLLFCSLVHASPVSRTELWKHGGVQFYIDLLHEGSIQTSSYHSLAAWFVFSHSVPLLVESELSTLQDVIRARESRSGNDPT